jgi:hypothetical protein
MDDAARRKEKRLSGAAKVFRQSIGFPGEFVVSLDARTGFARRLWAAMRPWRRPIAAKPDRRQGSHAVPALVGGCGPR